MNVEIKFRWSVVFLSLLILFVLFAAEKSDAQVSGATCILCHATAHVGGARATQTCILCHKTPHVQSAQSAQGTQSCIRCHEPWVDNGISSLDILSSEPHMDYLPLNIPASRFGGPFYTITEGYLSSSHNTPPSNPTVTNFVGCEKCHGRGIGHSGVGPIPKPIPNSNTCGTCHKLLSFDFKSFLQTSHANKDRQPGRSFDLVQSPRGQARVLVSRKPKVTATLFKSNEIPVTRKERIEECSVCHNYALQYEQFKDKIGKTGSPRPEVRCAACHNAHAPGPNGNQLLPVNVLQVTDLSGNTVTGVTPTQSRSVSYRNLKPYKVGADGGQDLVNGLWTRGSAVSRPNITIVSGTGLLGNGAGVSDVLTFLGGGFEGNVKPEDTVLISGVATAQVTIPATADPAIANQTVTVQTTLNKAGFEVEHVVDDNTLALLPGVKAGNVTVRYMTSTGTTATLTVPGLTFTGQVQFEVRDMRTNTESLCGSCHAQTTYKYTALGKNKDGTVNPAVTPATHNKNILGQYKNSGHGNIQNLAFAEFSAFEYGSSHQVTYPFDMSITGSGGAGTLRNPSNTSHQLLIGALDPTKLGLVALNKLTQPVLINNYACNQCHHGLASIDYQKNRQGTSEAQVLWGDATVTCITCHEPHTDATKTKKNIRVPEKLSLSSRFTEVGGRVNKFLDGTAIDAGVGNGIICLFCHQGRESGLTIYRAMKAANAALDPYATPDALISASGISFVNPHYLDGGAILWSKNAWEYFFAGVPQQYTTGNADHQRTNCTGCHMGEANVDNTEGGHTWKPRMETCQDCHGPITSFEEITALGDYDGDGVIETTFEELGTITPRVAPAIGSDGTGLFGQLVATLEAKGIFYNPDSHPYFFTPTGGTFNQWTPNTLSAAFNLAYSYKAGNAVYVHNAKYNVQVLQDALNALGVDVSAHVRPAGTRNANDYRTIVLNGE